MGGRFLLFWGVLVGGCQVGDRLGRRKGGRGEGRTEEIGVDVWEEATGWDAWLWGGYGGGGEGADGGRGGCGEGAEDRMPVMEWRVR